MVAPAGTSAGPWHSRQRDGLSPIPTVYRQRPEQSAQAAVVFGEDRRFGLGGYLADVWIVGLEIPGVLENLELLGIDLHNAIQAVTCLGPGSLRECCPSPGGHVPANAIL